MEYGTRKIFLLLRNWVHIVTYIFLNYFLNIFKIRLIGSIEVKRLLLLRFVIFYAIIYKGKGKGKAIPLQAWTGPEGSRRLRFPDFKTVGT